MHKALQVPHKDTARAGSGDEGPGCRAKISVRGKDPEIFRGEAEKDEGSPEVLRGASRARTRAAEHTEFRHIYRRSGICCFDRS